MKKKSLNHINNLNKNDNINFETKNENENKNINTDEIKDIINNKKETYSHYKDIELNNNSNNKIGNNDKDDMNNINLKIESLELYENVSDINDMDK